VVWIHSIKRLRGGGCKTRLTSRVARRRSSCAEKQAGLNVNNERQKFTKKQQCPKKRGRQRIRGQGGKAGSNRQNQEYA